MIEVLCKAYLASLSCWRYKSITKSKIQNCKIKERKKGKNMNIWGFWQTLYTWSIPQSLYLCFIFVFCILCDGGGKPCIDYTWSSPQSRLSASSIPRGRPEMLFCQEILNHRKQFTWGRSEEKATDNQCSTVIHLV